MTLREWLARHPYLQEAADFHATLESAVAPGSFGHAGSPQWDEYLAEFQAGMPVLRSELPLVDFDYLPGLLGSAIQALSSKALPRKLQDSIRALNANLQSSPTNLQRAAAWLLDRESFQSVDDGLLWFVGWTVLARHLAPVESAFSRWRDDEQWLRNYCPLCGAPPAMAQIAGTDLERTRLLSCGCCRSRWRYRRTACPFCEETDDRQLMTLVVEEETELRIDYCQACKGYIKTYRGMGNETLMLADWSSAHLDILAGDRGLKRYARSLYDIPSGVTTEQY